VGSVQPAPQRRPFGVELHVGAVHRFLPLSFSQGRTGSVRPMADERISWFPVLTDDELDEPERKLFAKATEVIGFVPNVFRTYAWRPERFRAWFAHFKTVMEGTPGLSAREREMISVAVSMANGCLY